MTQNITEVYPLEFLHWIEIPKDNKNAEVIFQMFSGELPRQEALGFWNLRQRAFAELKHHEFTDAVRAAASFAMNEDEIFKEATKRNVDVEDCKIAYKELQERYEKMSIWRAEELEEKAIQVELEKKELEEYRLKKQKLQEERFVKSSSQSYRQKPKDENAVQRGKINNQIMQKENELDDFSQLNRHFQENTENVLEMTHSVLGQTEVLMSQRTHDNKSHLSQERSIFLEVQHSLSSYASRQSATFEEIGRKMKNKKEDQLENLYQERNKLAW